MFDLISIGELLIDFFPDVSAPLGFTGKPGGAPCNVAAQAMRLGCSTAVICKLGEDQFGRYLKSYVHDLGIDDSYVTFTGTANTTLAFVHLDSSGNRSFSFYRKPGADQMLSGGDLPMDVLKSAGILTYGGVGLSAEPIRSTLFNALSELHGQTITAYDPNLRPPLWSEGSDAMRSITLRGMAFADIVKLADEELFFLTENTELESAIAKLLAAYPNIKLCVITAGAKGCYLARDGKVFHYPAYDTKVVDTTGSGDSFFGALLYRVLRSGKSADMLSTDELGDMLRYANAAGSLTAAGKGAIASMPGDAEIRACMSEVPLLII